MLENTGITDRVKPRQAQEQRRIRALDQIVPAWPTQDGAGVRLMRSLGGASLPALDPFLLLDEIRSDDPGDWIAGFPAHPHRGFEAVTYMIEGAMEHTDSTGAHGRLESGSVQWMTAGRGIIHSEMPVRREGRLWGFQLWINLPGRRKLSDPRYQDLPASEIPEIALEGGGRMRVVAGRALGATGPVRGIVTAPQFLDITLPPGDDIDLEVAEGRSVFAYVLTGHARFGDDPMRIPRSTLVTFLDGDRVKAEAVGEEGARFLLLSARPIGEPVARYGPFVMNTAQELEQAFADYRAGRLTD